MSIIQTTRTAVRKAAAVVGAIVIAIGAGLVVRNGWLWMTTYNYTSSLPRGWYVRAFRHVEVGTLLWFRLPDGVHNYVREFYPDEFAWFGKPRNGLLKTVVAVAGDTICRDESGTFSVNDRSLGVALTRDARDHPLPSWSGCRVVPKEHAAVFSGYSAGSIDSRYFGAIPIDGGVTYRPFITWETKH